MGALRDKGSLEAERVNLFHALLAFLLQTALPVQEVAIPGPQGATLRAVLVRPAGPATGAAIVALHGCDGPNPQRDGGWAQELAAQGHIVLLPDSFGSRGLGAQCREVDSKVTPSGLRRRDAIAAAEWLAAQPGTPPGGIVLMGWSNGGSTVMWTARSRPDLPAGLFRGFVAFYPGCRAASTNPNFALSAPMLVLVGENDDWTPAEPCRDLAARFPTQVDLTIYPGAWHGFDVPNRPIRLLQGLARTPTGPGSAHAGTDPAARADALLRVPAFIAALPSR
jgi:dienelactone hydrolase